MKEGTSPQGIIAKLDKVYQMMATGNLIPAFELVEEIGKQLGEEKENMEKDKGDRKVKVSFHELYNLHQSLRRRLLREMAENL